MLNISVNLTTGRATAVQAPVVKAGGDVPVVISFSANPGDNPVIELALSPQSSSPDVKAYLDVFVAQNSTTYTGTLDANDTRLIALLAGKQAQTLDCEIVVTTDAGRKPFPNFAVTVQPPVITGPESSEGGPVYLVQATADARYLRATEALAEINAAGPASRAAARQNIDAASQSDAALKLNRKWEARTEAFAAVAGGRYLVDTSAGTFGATLPPAPEVGDQIEFADAQNTWAEENLTIGRNGLKIAGETADLVCDISGAAVVLVYQGIDQGWRFF